MTLNLTFSGDVTFGGDNNVSTSGKPAKTHDLSSQIANNPTKDFVLNPPPVIDSLIVSLDGLVLRESPDGILGDYTYTISTSTMRLLVPHLEADSVVLAIYQEV